ncbi:MAG: cupin domain-containing protein [Rhodanobacteraceae bacterium]|nr:cupin domain-containing protein [Xanthomonadales bacterium]MCP5478083.1 cupin domain-containing protein [Rhodanobacteraceae bacterium]HRY00745.1 cupin domain-containing protein [Xanthomonadaceae bacterium]
MTSSVDAPLVLDSSNAPHYRWGADCDGWRLLDEPGLSVIEEQVPPGAAEQRHHHATSRQFFYVLDGVATLEIDGTVLRIAVGQGAQVAPGQRHRLSNDEAKPLRFLLCSAPNTRGDRFDEAAQ